MYLSDVPCARWCYVISALTTSWRWRVETLVGFRANKQYDSRKKQNTPTLAALMTATAAVETTAVYAVCLDCQRTYRVPLGDK